MRNCTDCKYADWKRTKNGRLHPSGEGRCKYPYKVPDLPNSYEWHGSGKPTGGYIDRKHEYEKHCPYYAPKDT